MDINDLDLMYLELGGSNPIYNLDGLGVVNNDDVTEWLAQASAADPLGRTFLRGDANLDGNVGALILRFSRPTSANSAVGGRATLTSMPSRAVEPSAEATLRFSLRTLASHHH